MQDERPARPTLVLLTGGLRTVVAAHRRHLAGRFRAAGWEVVEELPPPGAPAGVLAVLDDPWVEVLPEHLGRLASVVVKGPPRWRVPVGWGLPGAQAAAGRPPSTISELRRWRGRGAVRPLAEAPWPGLAVAAAGDAPALLAAGWPPAAGAAVVCESVAVFRYGDPARHARRELLAFVPASADRVVDVGCGHGLLSESLRHRGHRVLGIEPDWVLALAASQRVPVIPARGEDGLAAVRPGVDCVVFADVLEHTPDPAALLRAAVDVLGPAGRVVVSIPSAAWVPVLRALAAGRWDPTLAGVQARDHLYFTTPASFVDLAAECGLVAERMVPLGPPPPWRDRVLAWLLARLAGGRPFDLEAPQWVAVLRRP